ncbi:MAG: tRNA (N(6)-L-threonylcarbamoyladenosine(37)-C(2))-methylthiotransferase MtaB [Coriobacteriales bacterium]|jgi:threonylcarbamoyladenosine tRNA methylthiotransferase MtaB|nr:tRNA (N(6)-L-threonylcarbamoyladenosine(37)-C(2))-methylthiotransferase MtaB [Coriobacteriales bacterium]
MPEGFCIINLGCKVNRVDADFMAATLAAGGHTARPAAEAAVIVVNTCTVTAEADSKARKAVRQAARQPHNPQVIVTGCAVNIAPDVWKSLAANVLAIPDKTAACQLADKLLSPPIPAEPGGGNGCLATGSRGAAGCRPAGAQAVSDAPFSRTQTRTRVVLKVQDGCDNHCAYCIVPAARGNARSVPLAQISEQAQSHAAAGVREIVLCGINLGAYCSDGQDLVGLLQALLAHTEQTRFRLSSIEPQDVNQKLLTAIANSDSRICAHLHLPLQSGSNHVLSAMQRPYDTAGFARLVADARELLPKVALSTDVIVGFPGESEADFQQTLEFCRRMGFSRMHVFRYSRRPGTRADAMPNQVPPTVKASRAAQLHLLADELLAADALSRLSDVEQVLVEKRGQGTSESYHRIQVPDNLRPGSLLPLRFTSWSANLIQAESANSADGA